MIAKVSRPRIARTYPRDRLFTQLESRRLRPLIWVHGPPGVGKTTLLASYTANRALTTRWYQIDSGDSDPATFFYYLKLALGERRGAGLPLLLPEYMPDAAGFARRFFRAFAERLPGPSALVLDNFHELPQDSVLQGLLPLLIDELAPAANLFVISRQPPPAPFARAFANGQASLIGPEDLLLTVDETAAIVGMRRGAREIDSSLLHSRSNGWAAGVTLLLEGAATMDEDTSAPGAAPQMVFDYLANEVFEKASLDMQRLWLSTALMPRLTAEAAVSLSGYPHAKSLLDALCRDRYFVEKRPAPDVVYQYHDLFREFLKRRLQRTSTASSWRSVMLASADQLMLTGDHADAFGLYQQSEAWPQAVGVVLSQAPAMFQMSRVSTLAGWIAALGPLENYPQAAWLLYWQGATLAQGGRFSAARECIEQAYERFRLEQDPVGQCLAAAAMIDTRIFEWSECAALDPWIARLVSLLEMSPGFPGPEPALRVHASLLSAITYRCPHHPAADRITDAVWSLIRTDVSSQTKIMAVSSLMMQLQISDSLERATLAINEFRPVARAAEITPMQRIAWNWAHEMYHLVRADFVTAKALAEEAHALAVDNGLPYILGFLRLLSFFGKLPAGEFEQARLEIGEISAQIDHSRVNDVAMLSFFRAWIALEAGDAQAAVSHAKVAVGLSMDLGIVASQICCLSIYSASLAAVGDHEASLIVARQSLVVLADTDKGFLSFTALLVLADATLRIKSDAETMAVLTRAFEIGRRGGFAHTIVWLPDMISRVCAAALRYGIDVPFVEALIRRRRLAPPSLDTHPWVWPVEVRTLGPLEIRIDGRKLQFKGKSQKKPLELLRLLCGAAGRAVDAGSILQALWPDLDGDAARNALGLALHRLRKLLAHTDGIRTEEGRLSIDPAIVWLDTRAFERFSERSRLVEPPGSVAPIDHLFDLFRGPFADGDDAVWAIVPRERLRIRLASVVQALGRQLEADKDFVALEALFARSIDVEPLVEDLHRGLIAALYSQGRISAALDAYRRLSELVRKVFGKEPDPESRELQRRILSASTSDLS